jgi:DNA primase
MTGKSNVKNRMYAYLDAKFNLVQSSKGWYRFKNPFDSHPDKSMAVNFLLGVVKCFRSGYRSDIATFINVLNNVDDYKQVIKDYQPKEFIEYTRKEFTTELPEGYRTFYEKSFLRKQAINYIENRGFNYKDLALSGIGYCDSGKYLGRIIIPYYKEDDLVFFTGRTFVDAEPKYLNGQETTLGMSQVLYNSEALNMYREVYLLEGAFDALTIGNNAIAFGSNKLSSEQLTMINDSNCEVIKIVPDRNWYKRGLIHAMKIKKKCYICEIVDEKDVNARGGIEDLEFKEVTTKMIFDFFKKNKEN